jgi:DNA-binding PucR family transcriptional regulator
LGSDVELARDWVAYVLGPLAEDDPDTARLRETLEIFLTTGSNYSIAAEALHVHPNTVKYRIHKAESKLPAKIGGARIEVALALVLCSRLGTAVLSRRTE